MSAIATLMPGFEGTELPEWVERRLKEGMGGVCLFATNVESPAQVARLTGQIKAANPNAVISIDEEGGDVSRLYQHEGSPFPGNAVLGRLDDEDLTFAVAQQVGRELRAVGVNLTLAPDVDINSNAANPVIGVRAFGATPDLVSRHGVAWSRGVQSAGVAANAKHFPGHGDTSQDSHIAEPIVDASVETLRTRELAPFVAAIEGGAHTIMTSHISVPALDPDNVATFSSATLTDLLRGEFGFDGLIVSDALDMAGASGEIGIPAAAARALAAGCDLLCIGTANTDQQISEILTAIEDATAAGHLPSARIENAAERIGRLVKTLSNTADARETSPTTFGGAVPGLDAAKVREAFHVAPDVAARLAANERPVQWVQLEPEANIAVGPSPWGPFANGVAAVSVVEPHTPVDRSGLSAGALVIVVGKDNHRHEWARTAIESLRDLNPVVVDMGWPDLTEPYADVATFGASRLVGAALMEMV